MKKNGDLIFFRMCVKVGNNSVVLPGLFVRFPVFHNVRTCVGLHRRFYSRHHSHWRSWCLAGKGVGCEQNSSLVFPCCNDPCSLSCFRISSWDSNPLPPFIKMAPYYTKHNTLLSCAPRHKGPNYIL